MRQPWLARAVAVLLTAGAVALHLTVWRSGGGLWRDEVNSVVLATRSTPRELWANLHYDSFPLLWHLVLRAWVGAFGTSETAIRALGLVAGLGGVAALWRNARRFGGAGAVPLVGLLLLGYTASSVVYGDSIRAYGLGMALSLFTLGLIWDVADRPTAGRVAAATAVAAMGVHMTFYNSPLLLACCAGGAAVAVRRGHWRRAGVVLGIGAACGASVLVYVPVIARAGGYVAMLRRPWSLPHVGLKLADALARQSNQAAVDWPDLTGSVWVAAISGGALLIVGMLVAGVRTARRTWWARLPDRQRDACLYVSVALGVGIVGYVGFLRALGYEMQPWYFLTGLAMVAGCLDPLYGIACQGRWRRALAVAALAAGAALASPTASDATVPRTNLDGLAKGLRSAVAPGDVIVAQPWYLSIGLAYYDHGPVEVVPVPPVPFVQYHRFDQLVPFMRDPNSLAPTLERLRRTLRAGHRVWLVSTDAGLLGEPSTPGDIRILAAPSAKFGWSAAYYELAWRAKLLRYLRVHAVDVSPVTLVDAGGRPIDASNYEKALLIRVSGWRD